VQQAVNGRLAQTTGEPGVAALTNFVVGFISLSILAVVVAWGDHIPWGAPLGEWLGGLCGAFFVLVSAAAVRRLGVLRLMLVVVAGQTAGALVIDLIAPVSGEGVTWRTVVGLVLTLIGVFVSGRATQAAAEDASR
jgi:transporter family-2 protein